MKWLALLGLGLVLLGLGLASSAPAADLALSASPTFNALKNRVIALEAVPASHVPNLAGLLATSSSVGRIVRDGYNTIGDAAPLLYTASNAPCSLGAGAGDNGSQVQSSDGKCWIANFSGPIDWREFGFTYPANVFVSATGNDAGYCTFYQPCATVQRAVNIASKLDFKQQNAVVNITGPYNGAGFSYSGPASGGSGSNASGQYLVVAGPNATDVTLNAAPGVVANAEAAGGALLYLRNLNLAVASANYGIFAQFPGTAIQVGTGITCTGASGAVGCLYAEANAVVEMAIGVGIKIQGSFTRPVQGNTGGYIELDPGSGSGIDCGTGLTIPSGGAFLNATIGGIVLWSPTNITNCAGTTGDLLRAAGGGQIAFYGPAANPPGNGYMRLLDNSTSLTFQSGLPVVVPSLGTCVNGTLVSSSNNSMQINFSGANSSCVVNFGKLAGATGYFANSPICTISAIGGSVAPYFSSLSNMSFTIVASTWSNGQAALVRCEPGTGG